MNGLRYVIGLCILIFTVIVGLQGVGGYEKNEHELLRTTNVAEAFYQEGIEISLAQDLSPQDFILEGKLPVIYGFPGSEEKLFIYEYQNVEQRNKALTGIHNKGTLEKTKGFSHMVHKKEYLINTLQAKNVLLIYVIKFDSMLINEIQDRPSLDKFMHMFAPNLENIKEITFSKLNQGVTMEYRGSGQFWEGKALLKYYQYFWNDEDGKIHYESWNNQDLLIRYAGKTTDTIGDIMYQYDGPAGGGRGVVPQFDDLADQHNFIAVGSSGGNGALNINSIYHLTIRWGDKWETIVLERVK